MYVLSVPRCQEEVEDFCAVLISHVKKLKSRKLSQLPSNISTPGVGGNGDASQEGVEDAAVANGQRKVPIWRDIMMF